MAGLDPAIQSQFEIPCSLWMAASGGGHDNGIGGNSWVIKFRDDGGGSLARIRKTVLRTANERGR